MTTTKTITTKWAFYLASILLVLGLALPGVGAQDSAQPTPALPQVQMVLGSWQFRVFKRYVFKPLVISAVAAPAIALVMDRSVTLNYWLAIFAIVNLLINTPLGRNVDEMVTDWIVITWHRIRIGPITKLDDLNKMREKLRAADIDVLVIRVGD